MKLKYMAQLVAGGTPPVDDPNMWATDEGEGVPWVAISDMSAGGTVVDTDRRISAAGISARRLSVAEPGTVLFAMYASVGAVATLGTRATWNQAVLGIRPRNNRADGRFLAYWLRHLAPQMKALVRASTQDNLNADQVANFPVIDISLAEQRRIADFLDDQVDRIDHLIAARRRQSTARLALLRESLRQRWIELAKKYGVVRLAWWLRRLEQGWSPEADARTADEGEWGVMRAGCVNGGVFNETDHKALPVTMMPRMQYEIEPGDLLMSRASGSRDLIGSAAIVPFDVRSRLLLPDKIYRLSLARDISATYVFEMLRTPAAREVILSGISGAEGMANNIPSGIVRSIPVPAVPVSDQVSIASGFGDSWASYQLAIELSDRSIELLTELKRSLITAAVTGEFDVSAADGSGLVV